MTTPTTPERAMELASLIDAGEASAESANAMRSLAKQVDALTAERNALKLDAELYRHLRDKFAKNSADAQAEFSRLEPLTGAAFDAVVRASMDLMGVAA